MNIPLSVIATKRSEDWWLTRHQQKLAERQAIDQSIDMLFLGDSITHAWEVEGEEYWQQYFVPRKSLNLGYAGDRTEHLLWRIQNGEIDSLSPEWVVLLIGTNNAGHRHDEPENIGAGVKVILDELKLQLPQSKILLMAIFPRSRDNKKRMRKRVDATNKIIQGFTDQKHVLWLDINQQFLTEQGVLLESVMPDLLHLNRLQYEVWAKAILAFINRH